MSKETSQNNSIPIEKQSLDRDNITLIPSAEKALAYRRKPGSSIKNILIVALSTFPRDNNLSESRYICGNISGSYYYQLEPIPQFLIRKLRENGQRIDKILILATEETKKPVENLIRIISGDGERSADSGSQELLKAEDGKGISPLDYFIYSVNDGLKGALPPEYEIFSIKASASEQIPGETTISEIVSEIRNIHESNPRLNIYVDTHGGFRTTQEILNSVLSLLQLEGIPIQPDHVLTVEQRHGRRNEYEIRPAGSILQVLQFVTGMNELINYARSDSLESLMKLSSADTLERKIISDTKAIAEAIQICNIGGFESGLDDLNSDLTQYHAYSGSQSSLLRLFIDVIENNYKGIRKPDRSVIEEIRWCLQKGFYQQVLTLIESKIPEYLAQKGCFLMEGSDLEKVKKDCRRKDGTIKNEINNFVFNRTTYFLLNHDKNDLSVLYASANNANNVKADWHIWNKNHDFYESYLTLAGKSTQKFLPLHWALKSVRNYANHVNEVEMAQITLKMITDKVKQYVQIVESMTAHPKENHITVKVSYKSNDN